jgi:hypothetical protein
MAKVEVTDPSGVQWSVHRAWPDLGSWLEEDRGTYNTGSLLGDLLAPVLVFLMRFIVFPIVGWPFWFIAHWLGLRWVIVIERDGKEVAEEKVRGRNKSGRRIQEIAESAAAGTLQQSLGSPPATGPGG